MPVKIAILDSGVDVGHPELKKYFERNQIRYKSFIDGEEGNVDVCAHGTHMTHLILRVAPRAQVFVGRVFISGQATEMETNKMGIEKVCFYGMSSKLFRTKLCLTRPFVMPHTRRRLI